MLNVIEGETNAWFHSPRLWIIVSKRDYLIFISSKWAHEGFERRCGFFSLSKLSCQDIKVDEDAHEASLSLLFVWLEPVFQLSVVASLRKKKKKKPK